MNLPDTHAKVIRCLATCRTPEQLAGAKRYATLYLEELERRWWRVMCRSYMREHPDTWYKEASEIEDYFYVLNIDTNELLNP
jgi:hypothetical protein